ncbi:MAG: epimerase [Phyllobacteriaceae bacterium]|nr:epimerase [Phyllobacteriaceae bacterium]MBA92780.1 epimerase [Phyllobacteriaceae bacterium]
MARIFITGGAGFIGSRLARALRGEHAVTVYDNYLPQVHAGNEAPADWLDGVTIVRADVRDADALAEAIAAADPEIVYHLAAETGTGQSFDEPVRYNGVNIMGTANLIEAVRAHAPNLKRIVLAGSRSVYGEGACIDADGRPAAAVERKPEHMAAGDFEPRDAAGRKLTPVPTSSLNCPVEPASIYASTKLMQEYLLRQAFWGTPVEIGILRLQNVYGPGQSLNNPYTGVISIFRRQIEEGKTLNIFEDGVITRDFVFVDDVVAAFKAIGLVAECPRDIVDIGSGEATTILHMAKTLLSLMGRDPEKVRITGDFRAGDIRYAVADISMAREKLDWQPDYDLDRGLRAFLAWSAG